MARIGTSGSDPYQLSSGRDRAVPDGRRNAVSDAETARNQASLPVANRKQSATADVGEQAARKQRTQSSSRSVESDRSVIIAKEAAGTAARASAAQAYAESGQADGQSRYTLHSVPWEAGDYHSRQAIDLYQQNQRLPTSAVQTIEMLPRVNEQI